MPQTTIIYTKKGHIAQITLNRPEANNAINWQLAQEVEEIIPEIVKTDQNGYKSVDYARMTAVLVEAIKEQQIQIEDLKTDNESLRGELRQIKAALGLK